jgi:hypothetical protein
MDEGSFRLSRLAATIVAAAALLSACGSAASVPSASPAGLTELAPTTRPTATPRPAAPPTPRPTPTVRPTSTATPKPADTVIGETGRIVVPDQNFAITLPRGYKRIKLDATTLTQISDVFRPDSDMGRIMSSQMTQLLAAGVKLWAIDVSTKASVKNVPGNINVIVVPATAFDVSLIKGLAVSQLRSIKGISKVKATDVKLPVGPAVRVSYRASFETTMGITLAMQGVQYYLNASDQTFVLTFSCGALDSHCGDRADKSVKSFEALP